MAKIILLVLFLGGRAWGQPFAEDLEDSLSVEDVSRDSVLARLFKFEKMKPFTFIRSERRLKYQLNRLSLLANGRYLNRYQPIELMFEDMERLSERSRKKMFALALAGGAASETMRFARKILARYRIRFILPNLSGLHIFSRMLPYSSQLMLRLNPDDAYLVMFLRNREFMVTRRQTSRYVQNGFYWRFYKRFRLLGLETKYEFASFRAIGVTHYSKNLNFYLIYQERMEHPDRTRIFLECEARFRL